MVPLVVAPYGGKLPNGMAVQRTFGATRSVEFDAVVLAGSPAPGADARPARDSKAGDDRRSALDPRVVLLLQESFRHAKAIGAWGAGVQALEEAGVGADAPGVVTAGAPPRCSRSSTRCSVPTGCGNGSPQLWCDAREEPGPTGGASGGPSVGASWRRNPRPSSHTHHST